MSVEPTGTTTGINEALQAALGHQYRIERELGRGGMGLVYLARDLTLDREVAVKVVHPDLSTNRAVAARFLAEARTIARLRHPSIVSVHSAGEVDGQLYYVMDYLPGETLRQRLVRERCLSPQVAVQIGGAIAEALDAARAAGVVHRDLKPENILLEGPRDEPRALLADFGIARLLEEGGGHTGPGAVMGTPAYMSPEQAAGEELDGRSDLYSLGVVCYEMLTGAPPFTGPPRSVISKQILDAPPPLAELRSEVPAGVAAAIMRSLAKVPEERWASGREFRRALTGEETTPTPVRVAAAPRPPRRHWLFAAGIAAVVLATVMVASRRNGPPADVNPRHSILVLPFANVRETSSLQWLRDGSVNMLALALSQWRDLTVVDQDRVHDLVSSADVDERPIGLDVARRLARESRVWTVVLGDFTLNGDSLHLVARPYDVASGRRLDLVQVTGSASADVRSLFDELAAKLLDLTGAPQGDRASLTSVTTESLEAYRAYLRGLNDLNHWRLADASTALGTAVRLDSGFSLANYKLAIARGWVSPGDTIGLAAIRRASRTSEVLPARERSLIEGYRTFVEGDYGQAIAIQSQLLQKDSADVEAWYGLADAAFHGGYAKSDLGLLNQSLRGFRRVIGLDSGYALAYEHAGALLADAASPRNWTLLSNDSLIPARYPSVDSARAGNSRRQAADAAVTLARAWTRIQPNTPRAQYHLYKAYLASGRVTEARQTLVKLRTMHPDSSQAFFALLDARAQFAGGDIRGAADAVRRALPAVRPAVFNEIDYAPEPLTDLMTGVNALGYFGDLKASAQLISLAGSMRETRVEERDSLTKAQEDEVWELARLGLLYGAAGVRADRLRSIWARGIELAKAGPSEHRGAALSMLVNAAVGLLLGPPGDGSAVAELERLTNQPRPPALGALVAARAGNPAEARRLLAASEGATPAKSKTLAGFEWGGSGLDWRPIEAEAYFELEDYERVVEILKSFDAAAFSRRGFDPRWILLPRVRLLRGQALEHLGRGAEAGREYRAVIDQWASADPELLPVVQQARLGLARVAGTPEVT